MSKYTVALIGNPNAGKSSIFNQLTGLRQKVANFPGVTVDKKVGKLTTIQGDEIELIDFPGTYSLYPTTSDEKVVTSILSNARDAHFPDAVIYVADAVHLEKHLLLLTQIKDMNLPTLFVLNMIDLAQQANIKYDYPKLEAHFGVEVIPVSGKFGINMDLLREGIDRLVTAPRHSFKPFYTPTTAEVTVIQKVTEVVPVQSSYQALVIGHHYKWLPFLNAGQKMAIDNAIQSQNFHDLRFQIDETMRRYDRFVPMLQKATVKPKTPNITKSDKIDRILTHRILGPAIFFITIFLVFQSIFTLAQWPMDFIDSSIAAFSNTIKSLLPASWWSDLICDGLIAGLGGIIVFVPQIAILFFLLALLEESGYMARVVFMFDSLMQKFGLNGRSLVAMVSGGACAIPAIMSTRTIENWKERLITIFVTPLISCSARIPVYAVLVSFVVPAEHYWLGFKAQGWLFTGLYLLGIGAALVLAFVMKFFIHNEENSSLMMELPSYRLPILKNTLITVREKVAAFVFGAGKVILTISVVLWFLSYFGPSQSMQSAENQAITLAKSQNMDDNQTQDLIASKKIEASYAGHAGKWIEPAIRPLGFDWKIGIALLTSFAAREVFVGTMATIYSVGSAGDDEDTIRDRMRTEVRADGTMVYTTATAVSLLIFYVFAMQCMSTLAIVKRETNSWKWAILQFVLMSIMAYGGSWLAYTILC